MLDNCLKIAFDNFMEMVNDIIKFLINSSVVQVMVFSVAFSCGGSKG